MSLKKNKNKSEKKKRLPTFNVGFNLRRILKGPGKQHQMGLTVLNFYTFLISPDLSEFTFSKPSRKRAKVVYSFPKSCIILAMCPSIHQVCTLLRHHRNVVFDSLFETNHLY